MTNAEIDRLFDFANKYCPRCLRFLPPFKREGIFRRGLWLYESMQRTCACGFAHGYPKALTVREAIAYLFRWGQP